MQDLAAGGLDFTTCSVPEARAMLDAGRARSLAVMAPARLSAFPNIPTLQEAMGIDFTTGAMRIIAGPAGLPAEVVAAVGPALKKVYDSKEYQDFMNARGFGLVYADAAGAGERAGRGRYGAGRCHEGGRAGQGLIGGSGMGGADPDGRRGQRLPPRRRHRSADPGSRAAGRESAIPPARW